MPGQYLGRIYGYEAFLLYTCRLKRGLVVGFRQAIRDAAEKIEEVSLCSKGVAMVHRGVAAEEIERRGILVGSNPTRTFKLRHQARECDSLLVTRQYKKHLPRFLLYHLKDGEICLFK